MSLDALAAAAAGALAVPAAYDLLAATDGSALVVRGERLLAPLRRAGREGRAPTAVEQRRLAALSAGVLLCGGWLMAGLWAGVALAAGGPWLALALVRARRARHRAALAGAAPVVARALADTLTGGHSVHGAVVEAARTGGVPGAAGGELARAAEALALGDPVDDALERLRLRAACDEYDTIVAAIALQRRAGGDLAGLLRQIAAGIEDASRLEADARAATAQARFTGLMVAGLPLGAAALAELASPGYLAGLAGRPLTAMLALVSGLLQLCALVAIRRLGRVER
jgi:tight adherence protein B